jgi:hypothetical protein
MDNVAQVHFKDFSAAVTLVGFSETTLLKEQNRRIEQFEITLGSGSQ